MGRDVRLLLRCMRVSWRRRLVLRRGMLRRSAMAGRSRPHSDGLKDICGRLDAVVMSGVLIRLRFLMRRIEWRGTRQGGVARARFMRRPGSAAGHLAGVRCGKSARRNQPGQQHERQQRDRKDACAVGAGEPNCVQTRRQWKTLRSDEHSKETRTAVDSVTRQTQSARVSFSVFRSLFTPVCGAALRPSKVEEIHIRLCEPWRHDYYARNGKPPISPAASSEVTNYFARRSVGCGSKGAKHGR